MSEERYTGVAVMVVCAGPAGLTRTGEPRPAGIDGIALSTP
ncbi:hypothetical protein [Streptomyces sp. NPDC002044]